VAIRPVAHLTKSVAFGEPLPATMQPRPNRPMNILGVKMVSLAERVYRVCASTGSSRNRAYPDVSIDVLVLLVGKGRKERWTFFHVTCRGFGIPMYCHWRFGSMMGFLTCRVVG
jgi:hypothetical protein